MNENKTVIIKSLLDDPGLSTNEMINALNEVLPQLDISEQLQLHGNLSNRQLSRFYDVISLINISPSAKEHILWKYFKYREEEEDAKLFSNDLIVEIIECYRKNKYTGIESIIIEALKNDRIMAGQLHILEDSFFGKKFVEEAAAFKCRELRRNAPYKYICHGTHHS
ncbi:hypothetical protein EBB07_21285 [Paenibacillaceae bacterium]|nr:hypothetical protein EBB07_21285 [Paenibacillaceae bacterium]